MPLTPEDVSNKRFTPVRLREGYDMGEVDQFLDEVEAELARLTEDNEDLRRQLDGEPARASAPATPEVATGTTDTPAAGSAAPPADEPSAGPAAEAVAAPAGGPEAPAVEGEQSAPTAEGGVETVRVVTAPEASKAAARLLEIATRNADELVEEARTEAETIVGEARTTAETLSAQSQQQAEQTEAEARTRSERLDAETEERRTQMLGDLEHERTRLGAEVENLRSFEREYRSRLKSYFAQQLEALDSAEDTAAPEDPAPATAQPKRLRSVLDDDEV